jgi:hypothetical protein
MDVNPTPYPSIGLAEASIPKLKLVSAIERGFGEKRPNVTNFK